MSIGAIKSFSEKMTNDDASLGRLAVNLDTNVETLSAWAMAADKMGGSSEGMISSIKGMVSAVNQFSMTGKGGESFQYFMSGPGGMIELIDQATGKMRPFDDILLDAADKLKAIADTQGMAKAQEWGVGMGYDYDTINVLVLGHKAILDNVNAQKKLAIVTGPDAKNAQERQIAWKKFGNTLENVWRGILLTLSPSIVHLTDEATKWVNSLDLTFVNENIDKFGEYLKKLTWEDAKKGAESFLDPILKLADALNVLMIPLRLLKDAGTWLGETVAKNHPELGENIDKALQTDAILLDDTTNFLRDKANWLGDKAKAVMDFFISKGWASKDAAGITAGLKAESPSFNPQEKQKGGGPGRGIAQWEAPRQKDFIEWSKKNGSGTDIMHATLPEELEFTHYELTKGSRKKAGDAIKASTSAKEAGAIASRKYFQPRDAEGQAEKRGNAAQDIFAKLKQLKELEVQNKVNNTGLSPSQIYAQMNANKNNKSNGNTSTNTSDVKIATINVNTQAIDAKGIARDITGALKNHTFVNQANAGVR
jgi:hypothetical protein